MYKIVYYTIFLIIPLLVIDLPIWQILLGFVFLHLIEGATLSVVFQLAHTVEGPEFPEPDQHGNMENSWAAHQMHTTADFARKSRLVNFLFGGLNFQIEHHLFPRVCHIHYRKIAPIVEQAAREFGLPYHDNTSFYSAIRSHVYSLKAMGRPQ